MTDGVKIYSANEQFVSLTPAALTHIKKHIASRGHGIGVRFGVEKAGCSGMKYVFDYVDEKSPEDKEQVIDADVSIFINDYSLPYVNGVKIDYVKEGINYRFKFINPNEKGACGCGESFQV